MPVDELTVAQCADVLDRLTAWPDTGHRTHTRAFADAFSRSDTDAPGIASWTQALAARRRCAEGGEL